MYPERHNGNKKAKNGRQSDTHIDSCSHLRYIWATYNGRRRVDGGVDDIIVQRQR